ncbi:MAG: hypothetical protein Ct9H300mP23_01170 [Nitrospinota bacterium]|nr:MAG: hypothetical protein Ct9H300mP23_01170 [Nitrospinota bacterium]
MNRPQEEISQIHWEVEVIKFKDDTISSFEACHTTELADKTLKFYTDKSLNEFIEKSFQYFEEFGGTGENVTSGALGNTDGLKPT